MSKLSHIFLWPWKMLSSATRLYAQGLSGNVSLIAWIFLVLYGIQQLFLLPFRQDATVQESLVLGVIGVLFLFIYPTIAAPCLQHYKNTLQGNRGKARLLSSMFKQYSALLIAWLSIAPVVVLLIFLPIKLAPVIWPIFISELATPLPLLLPQVWSWAASMSIFSYALILTISLLWFIATYFQSAFIAFEQQSPINAIVSSINLFIKMWFRCLVLFVLTFIISAIVFIIGEILIYFLSQLIASVAQALSSTNSSMQALTFFSVLVLALQAFLLPWFFALITVVYQDGVKS